jgi:hypothetical protein
MPMDQSSSDSSSAPGMLTDDMWRVSPPHQCDRWSVTFNDEDHRDWVKRDEAVRKLEEVHRRGQGCLGGTEGRSGDRLGRSLCFRRR